MTLINYIYTYPKAFKKLIRAYYPYIRGGVVLNEESALNEVVYHNLSRAAGQISMLSTNLVFTVKNEN